MPNNEKPLLVSVVMAVYNCERYLEEAVESILAQTFEDFEFIIVNDGSTDRSGELLDRLAAGDSRIRVFHQENTGLTKSLNRGLALSRGELIARMDGDDIAMPERFALQVAKFKDDPDLVLLGSEVELMSEDGRDLGPRGHDFDTKEIRRSLLKGDGGALTHPVVMMRRTAIEKTGPYDERFTTTQDLDLFIRLSEVGKLGNLRDSLLKWRQHPQSVNRTKSATWSTLKKMAIGKVIERNGVDAYLAGLYDDLPPFSFPSNSLDLADFASGNGRYETALSLCKREMRSGERRRQAFARWIKITIAKFLTGTRTRIRKILGAS